MYIHYEGMRKTAEYRLFNTRMAYVEYDSENKRELLIARDLEVAFIQCGFNVSYNDCSVIAIVVEDFDEYKDLKSVYKDTKKLLLSSYPAGADY